jgi:hypothetical protein
MYSEYSSSLLGAARSGHGLVLHRVGRRKQEFLPQPGSEVATTSHIPLALVDDLTFPGQFNDRVRNQLPLCNPHIHAKSFS